MWVCAYDLYAFGNIYDAKVARVLGRFVVTSSPTMAIDQERIYLIDNSN
jgi:hypothetical protein